MTAPAVEDVLAQLRALSDPSRLEGMARYGIGAGTAWGVTVSELRSLADLLGHDHRLADDLWRSGVHEARILAGLVDHPAQVDEAQCERWAADFASWDLCDQVCQNLFRHTRHAWTKAAEWSGRTEPFVKRAGFALMAGLAVADKESADDRFEVLLATIAAQADDERPLVRKGASWALRAIGKRNPALHRRAVDVARGLRANGGRGARWVGTDALRELTGPRLRARWVAAPD